MDMKLFSMNRRTFTVTTGAAALAAGSIAKVAAQDATPVEEGQGAPGLPPLPEGATVVATGLYGPRHIAFADDGTMYVAETGTGGDEMLAPAASASPVAVPADATPDANAAPPSTRGYSGQISAVASDGTQSVVVSGLASYSDGVGPVGVTVHDGKVYFTVGGAAVESWGGAEPLIGENCVHVYDPESDEVTQVADINAYEVANNPDGGDVNPNLFGITSGDNDGRLTVNDAGGNTVYSVDAASGALQVRVTFPTLDKIVADGGFDPRQVVPTGGTFVGNTYYTAFLSEVWPAEAPSIVSIAGDGAFATWSPTIAGLSFVTDIATGPDGVIYYCQLFDVADGPPIGSIHRIVSGAAETVVEGLVMPIGIAFDGDGNLYVSIYALMSAPGQPAGQVVRFDGVAAPA